MRGRCSNFYDPKMTSNFILYQNYAIHFENKHLDLHNNFLFEEFSYNTEKRQLILKWKGTKADWVPADNPRKLVITINEVEFLKIIPRNYKIPFSEDNCLNDLTYYLSSKRDEHECVYGQEKPTENDDIIFKFQGGQIIRAKGSEIKVSVE